MEQLIKKIKIKIEKERLNPKAAKESRKLEK